MDNKLISDKEKYVEYCSKNTDIPIFYKNWWLDAVCGDNNWSAIISENNNDIQAVHPIYLGKSKVFRKNIYQPPLTPYSGTWINYPQNQIKSTTRLAYEKRVVNDVISKIKKRNMHYFNQNFHYNFSNWLPYYWNGFDQTTHYTYIIKDLSNLELVYDNFDNKLRTDIRKAEKNVLVKRNLDINIVYDLVSKTFDRQNQTPRFNRDFLKRLDDVCIKNNCREIFYAIDDNENIHGCLYLIWDCNSAYYLFSGSDPKYRNSQALSLLVWEAIKFSANVTGKFDFEGSMIEGVEGFFRSFGATQQSCFKIKYERNKFLGLFLKSFINSTIIKIVKGQ